MAQGRYAALLEPSKPPTPTAGSSPLPRTEGAARKQDGKKPASLPTHKPTNPQTHLPVSGQTVRETESRPKAMAPVFPPTFQGEVVEKYTTRLKPSMVKKVKVFAAERDIKDYEVVENALLEYFARHAKE